MFPLSLSPWLPDETLFSWASRYHVRACNALARRTCQQLFGHPRLGTQHDFPCNLDVFVDRTDGLLGDAQAVIYGRTLLPYYLPFVLPAAEQEAIARLRGSHAAGLKSLLGLIASGFRAHHPLRACDQCIEEDRHVHGIAYWHRQHQWPGALLCLRHNTLLAEADVKANHVGRFLWYLPAMTSLKPVKDATLLDARLLSRLRAMSEMAHEIGSLTPGTVLHAERLRSSYRAALQERGFVTANGSLRLAHLGKDYLAEVRPVLECLGFGESDLSADRIAEEVGRLLRAPRGNSHPLRHMLVALWLFKDFQAWRHAYVAADSAKRGSRALAIQPTQPQSSESRRKELALVQMVVEEGLSARKAAAAVGVDVSTALVWAARAGANIARRPKVMKLQARDRVIAALRRGREIRTVAKSVGISIGLVRSVLRAEVGLQGQWKQMRMIRTGKRWRRNLRHLLAADPTIGRKALRTRCSAGYAWLYRNDREWLKEFLNDIPEMNQGNNANVDWIERDASMVAELIHALESAHLGSGSPLWKICQKVPGLRPKLRKLDQMPMTRDLLAKIRSRHGCLNAAAQSGTRSTKSAPAIATSSSCAIEGVAGHGLTDT